MPDIGSEVDAVKEEMREALIQLLNEVGVKCEGGRSVGEIADHLMTRHVVIEQVATWLRSARGRGVCSKCGRHALISIRCPRCGAKMIGVEKED